MAAHRYRLIFFFLILDGMPIANEQFGSIARATGEPKDVLAAQIRIQGFECGKPQRVVLDTKRSRPDHDVWVLTFENATYKVSRYPDLAAKVELLR